VAYIAAFIPATALLTVFGYTGYLYLAAALVLGLIWLRVGLKGLTAGSSQPSDLQDDRWAKQVFGTSIIVLTLLSLAIGIDSFLPR
jgi:protoheme IX farnesyltransferase